MQRDDHYLWRHVQAERCEAAKSRRHVQRTAATAVQSAVLPVHEHGGPPPHDAHLSAMRVSTECEGRTGTRKHRGLPRPRVVLHHHHEGAVPHPVQRTAVVGTRGKWRTAVILRASHHYGVAATAHHAVRIGKQPPAEAALRLAQPTLVVGTHGGTGRHIHGVVVIAEHGKYAVASTQPPQVGAATRELRRLHVLQVACEHHGIGTGGIHAVYGPSEQSLGQCAGMYVRQLHYTVALEGRRQTVKADVYVPHHQLPCAEGEAIDGCRSRDH